MAATWLNGLKRVHIESPVSAVLMELNEMPTKGKCRKILALLSINSYSHSSRCPSSYISSGLTALAA